MLGGGIGVGIVLPGTAGRLAVLHAVPPPTVAIPQQTPPESRDGGNCLRTHRPLGQNDRTALPSHPPPAGQTAHRRLLAAEARQRPASGTRKVTILSVVTRNLLENPCQSKMGGNCVCASLWWRWPRPSPLTDKPRVRRASPAAAIDSSSAPIAGSRRWAP